MISASSLIQNKNIHVGLKFMSQLNCDLTTKKT